MNHNLLFSSALAAGVAVLLSWGLRVLPREHMQVLATIPVQRREDGLWRGVNLTWYGVLQMLAMVLAVALALVLAGAAGVPLAMLGVMVGALLALGLPAARWVARLVEKKQGTLTVGGAVFVVTLCLPWVALGWDIFRGSRHALPGLAALAVAYPLGEGIGRLACISFGCCYGRRIEDCGPRLRALFARRAAVVIGPTRKAAYAGGCEGVPLIPAPAMSALLLSAAGLAGVPLFLSGAFRAAGLLALGLAFAWRFLSELLRADDRGAGRLSVYQWMTLAALIYVVPVFALLPAAERQPEVVEGLRTLGSPVAILALLALGVMVFVYLGVSTVTGATIRLEVRSEVRSEVRCEVRSEARTDVRTQIPRAPMLGRPRDQDVGALAGLEDVDVG